MPSLSDQCFHLVLIGAQLFRLVRMVRVGLSAWLQSRAVSKQLELGSSQVGNISTRCNMREFDVPLGRKGNDWPARRSLGREFLKEQQTIVHWRTGSGRRAKPAFLAKPPRSNDFCPLMPYGINEYGVVLLFQISYRTD